MDLTVRVKETDNFPGCNSCSCVTYRSDDSLFFFDNYASTSFSDFSGYIGGAVVRNDNFNSIAAAMIIPACGIYRIKQPRKVVLFVASRDYQGESWSKITDYKLSSLFEETLHSLYSISTNFATYESEMDLNSSFRNNSEIPESGNQLRGLR